MKEQIQRKIRERLNEGKMSIQLKNAIKWLKDNKTKINTDDVFDYPDYWGLPKSISNKLSSDEVDYIQNKTYHWRKK